MMVSCDSEYQRSCSSTGPDKAPLLDSAETNTDSQCVETSAICSAISLSQWLDAVQPADSYGQSAYEVEQTERAAFESFLQGYSLL